MPREAADLHPRRLHVRREAACPRIGWFEWDTSNRTSRLPFAFTELATTMRPRGRVSSEWALGTWAYQIENAEFLVPGRHRNERVPRPEQGCGRHLRHPAPHPRVASGRQGMPSRAESRWQVFLEEPSATAIRLWDAIFHWDHPRNALFSKRELENHLRDVGFVIRRRLPVLPFRVYCVEKK